MLNLNFFINLHFKLGTNFKDLEPVELKRMTPVQKGQAILFASRKRLRICLAYIKSQATKMTPKYADSLLEYELGSHRRP